MATGEITTSRASSKEQVKLEWFPFYIKRIAEDVHYRTLTDYQQGWYLNLLFAAWQSERPGYLPDDGRLWRIANARTRQFFEKKAEAVLCMFEREDPTTDDGPWICHRALLQIYHQQLLKFHKLRKVGKSADGTRGRIISVTPEPRASKKQTGRKRKATAEKTYVQVAHEVDHAIPRFQTLMPMRRRTLKDLLAFGCSEHEIDAIRMAGSRSPKTAARWFIAISRNIPFDTVAQYHKRSKKTNN